MLKALFLAGLAGAVPSSAYAADWVRYESSRNGTIVYYDADSVRNVGDLLYVWEKRDHSRDSTIGWRETKILQHINCGSRQSAMKQYATFKADGSVDESGTIPDYKMEWEEVIPDSILDGLMKAVCTNASE